MSRSRRYRHLAWPGLLLQSPTANVFRSKCRPHVRFFELSILSCKSTSPSSLSPSPVQPLHLEIFPELRYFWSTADRFHTRLLLPTSFKFPDFTSARPVLANQPAQSICPPPLSTFETFDNCGGCLNHAQRLRASQLPSSVCCTVPET